MTVAIFWKFFGLSTLALFKLELKKCYYKLDQKITSFFFLQVLKVCFFDT